MLPRARSVALALGFVLVNASIALGAGCQAGASGSGSAAPPSSASASLAAVPVRRCGTLPDRCISDDEAEACSEDGREVVRTKCDAASVCLAGRCTSLRAPDAKREVTLRREDLFAVAGEGWLNGFSMAGPLQRAEEKRVAEDPSAAFAGDLALRPACAPSGYVPVHERERQKLEAPESMLLAGYLVSPSAQKVVVRAGFGGGARLFLGGRLALEASRPASPRPFKDEVLAEAELRAGVNPLVILLERTSEAASGLWLRLRDLEGRPVPGLNFAAVGTRCSLGDLVDVDFDPKPVKGGFSVDVSLNLRGLAPRALPEAPYRAELLPKDKPALEITKGTIGLAGMTEGKASVTLSVQPPAKASYGLVFTAGAKDEVSRRATLIYRGDLHDRVVALNDRIATIPASTSPEASRDSIAHHGKSLLRSIAESHPDEAWIKERTKDAQTILKTFEEGRDPYREKTGIVRRAYRSELDGELQPYVVFVPPSYKPDKAAPLIITFHGLESQPEHALRSVIGRSDKDLNSNFAARHLPSFPDYGAILAAPWGYGKAGPRQLGEHDVLRVIREMRAHYAIDERRISITGASLGGTVAFVVPLHYPDLFSASAPLCGYPNLLTYQSVRSVPHAPWEDTLLQKRYIGNYAENGLHLPLHIVHGGRDVPERSKVIADRYKELGYSHTFDVQEDLDHNVWEYAYEDGEMIAWLKARRRPDLPAHVRFVTGEYRYSKAYWVRLIAMQDDAKLAAIDARYNREAREARVTTKNVGAFALDLTGFKVPADSKVVIDGKAVAVPEGAGQVFFTLGGGGFERTAEEPSRSGMKRPGVAGPLDDIHRHPQLIVYGTQSPAELEANKMVAEHASSYDTWAYARYPIKADVDVTEADLRGKSLVLIGGPTSNKVTKDLIDGLPVRFEPGAIVLRGERYEGRGVGVSLIYPHPKSDGEYVVLHAGVTAEGTLASRHLPQLAPDFLVYDAKITVQRGELLLDKRAVLDGGFFDQRWK